MIAMPMIGIFLWQFPIFFEAITILTMLWELVVVILVPVQEEDVSIAETDKMLPQWILRMKAFFKQTAFTRFLGTIPPLLVLPMAVICTSKPLIENPYRIYGISVLVASSDVLQYYIGKNFGKIYPFSISPKKTLEGYIGGSLLCIAQAYLMMGKEEDFLFKGLYLIIFGIIGDLFNSFWKRIMGIKDSSSILGSHGGIHDRFGSVIFAIFLSEILMINYNFIHERIGKILILYSFCAFMSVIIKLLRKQA